MDSGKFDDIIKDKLESFEDPIGPSASELSRLTRDLPHVSPPSFSWTSRAILVTNVVLLITTIFYVYRTFVLEEQLVETRNEVVQLEEQVRQDTFLDSLVFDSLRVTTESIITAFAQERDSLTQVLAEASFVATERAQAVPEGFSQEDVDVMVQAALEDFVTSLQEDPTLLATLMESNASEPIEVVIEKPRPVTFGEKLQDLSARAEEDDYLDDILVAVADDSVGNRVLKALMTNTDPNASEEDQLGTVAAQVTTEEIEELPTTEKRELFERLVLADEAVALAATEGSVEDDDFLRDLAELSPPELMLVSREEQPMDSVLVTPVNIDDIREEAIRRRNRSWWLSAGAGVATTKLNEAGSQRGNAISALIERKMNPRWSMVTGLEYSSLEGETYDTGSLDLTPFDDIPTDILGDIKELKVNLTWMDIPFEGRLYLLPDRKINPFLGASLRTRFILNQSYKIESNSNGDFTPDFESGNTFSLPVFGFTGGAVFEFGPRVSGGVRVQQTLGGSNLGPYDNKLNSLSGQAMLIFRLDQ